METNFARPRQVVLVLDQNAASLRWAEDTIFGFDLYPDCKNACDKARSRGVEVMLALPVRPGTKLPERFAGTEFPVVPMGSDFSFDSPVGVKAAPGSVLIAADRKLRGAAHGAGMIALPHLSLLDALMVGETPMAARLQGKRDVLMRFSSIATAVPMHFQPGPDGVWAWIGILTKAALAEAVELGLDAAPLPYEVTTDDLFWVRPDHFDAGTKAALKQRTILHAEKGQMLIALGPDESPEALGIHGEHGHAQLLSPTPQLIAPVHSNPQEAAIIDTELLDLDVLTPVRRIDPDILRLLLRPRCSTVTANYVDDLDRYTGVSALDANGPIVSRHIAHPDNARAEAQLIRDLQAMGYCAIRHDFQHAGQTHSNIIADLPGTGRYFIRPDWLNRWRELLVRIDTDRLNRTDLGELGGLLQQLPKAMLDLPQSQLAVQLADILHLRPWYPWWCLRTPVSGIGAGIIVVGCHLDSTAAFDSGYSPATDAAPGRDDDGSGLAGVLSIARHMTSLRGKLTHTVRFCFFNAEEAGLVGSQAYAAMLKAQNAPVRAAICMDMIGYNTDSYRLWEVHAGYTDPAIRDLSLPVANQIAAAGQDYNTLAAAQIYKGTSAFSGAPDRNVYDGAINRSDHASFHQQGWPAVVVSEDFFANLASEPASDGNVNYHRAGDTFVDTGFARDIVCAVARAVTQMAQ